jgi:hypothetical protein
LAEDAVNVPMIEGQLIRASNLTQDLGLTDDHRIDAGCDPKQVPDRAFVVIRVQPIGDFLRRDVTEVRQEVAEVERAPVKLRHDRVDLDAVACRQEGGL